MCEEGEKKVLCLCFILVYNNVNVLVVVVKDCVKINNTKWPKHVRELILDSDPEILEFWSLAEKNMIT